jgi:hypothetical protein
MACSGTALPLYTFEVPYIYVQSSKDDNGRPHTSLKTREAITEFGWTVLLHITYSPDLVPSDFNLYRAVKMCPRCEV